MRLFAALLLVCFLCKTAYSKEYVGELTAYCPCKICCGDFPGKIFKQTASGKIAAACRTLAAPRGIPFGTKILAKFLDEIIIIGTVEDRGGAITMNGKNIKIDIYFDTHQEALNFGRMKNITIFIKEILK